MQFYIDSPNVKSCPDFMRMKDNYLFDRVCKECTKFEDKVSDGWQAYPVAKSLSGVYIDIMEYDEDCYDGIYVTSVRQAKVFLKEQLKFLGGTK